MFNLNRFTLFFIAIVLLLLTAYFSLITGTIQLSFDDISAKIINGHNENFDSIIDLRLPRIIIAIIVGAMLAVSGALLQVSLQNPLADANIIGVSSGALIMRTLCMYWIPQLYFYIPFITFIGGLLPFLIILLLNKRYNFNTVSIILIGVAMFVILNGIIEIMTQNPLMKIPQGLTMKTWQDVKIIIIAAIIGSVLVILLINKLNLLNLDDVQATSIGFKINRFRWITGLIAVFLASATVAIVGQMAFLGIIVPHVVRKLVGGNYKIIIPLSTIIGAWLLLVADFLGRTIQPPIEIPANALLMIIGGPVLIYLICIGKNKKILK